MRYLYLLHADPTSPPPSPQLLEALHAMAHRERQAGRMIFDGGLTPIQVGAKLELKDRKVKMLDGPFTESKEVVVGFAIFEFPTREAAIKSAQDFLDVHRLHGDGSRLTCEMREIFSPPG